MGRHTHRAQPILMWPELCITDFYKGRDSETQDNSDIFQEVWKQ